GTYKDSEPCFNLKVCLQQEGAITAPHVHLRDFNVEDRPRLACIRKFILREQGASHWLRPPMSGNAVMRSVRPSRPMSIATASAAAASTTKQNAVGKAPVSPSASNRTHM